MKEDYLILIVDDHKLFREGLNLVISTIPGFKIAGEASDSKIFIEMLDNIKVDIVLMDICMPGIDGISATEQALAKHPDLKIIALTMFCDREYFVKMLQAGAVGYILKDSGKEELARALKNVSAGEKYFSQKLLHNIILYSNGSKDPLKSVDRNCTKFNQLEIEILKMICQGYSNTNISKLLSISLHTLDEYKLDLFSKTGVKDSLNLALYAYKNKMIDI